MSHSGMSVQSAASASTEHRFPWRWYLADLPKVLKNGKKVFSCFSCGGGSSMGYKLAGFEVIGCCELDPAMMKVYRQNNHPRYAFKQMKAAGVIPSNYYPNKILSGQEMLNIITLCLDKFDATERN